MTQEFNDDPNYVPDGILNLFSWRFVPADVQNVCRSFEDLASEVDAQIKPGPLKAEALQCLLLARNNAVRAHIAPGTHL